MPLWRLRPGFQFARLMTYDELCDFVNMGVRKDGADAFRVKRRRRIQVQGGTIPKSVTFYCNRGRAHGDEAGRESKRTPNASRNSRAQEARRIIYSGCSCSFVVTRMQAHLWWACSGQMQGRPADVMILNMVPVFGCIIVVLQKHPLRGRVTYSEVGT